MDRARLESQLVQAEGCKSMAYKDTEGYWTAGVGHLLDQRRDWTGVTFDTQQISEWLDADITQAEYDARQLLEWPFLDTDARQNAVIELVFNLGVLKWMHFAKCRRAITKKDWQTAHDQLLDSVWARQVGPGRSTRLANMLLKGEFQE
jgi:lysozyme